MNLPAALPDRRLSLITLLLVGLGIIMVYASSTYRATLGDATEFSLAARQTQRALVGLVVLGVAAALPYRLSARLALYGLPVAMGLLLLTVLGGAGVLGRHGINRWVHIAGVVVQPVEMAKLCLALALPWWIDRHPEVCTRPREFFRMAAVPGLVVVLLALQPNFGSALALSLLTLSIFWLGGVSARFLSTLLAGGVMLCWLAYLHVNKVHERVDAWWSLLAHGRADGDYGYQSFQALSLIHI